MNLPSSITISEIAPDYPILEIAHSTCTGKIALHGAHVMSWKPSGENEVLYLSPEAIFTEGKAIRGGIPVCWPWFNAHPTNPDLPSHGVVRSIFWKLDQATEDESGVTVLMSVRKGDWQAALTVHMGTQLEVSLKSHNPSNGPIQIAGALHTYLSVSDIEKIQITGLENTNYLDTVGERGIRHQEGVITFSGEVDRIYDSSSSICLVDAGLKRTILVEKAGSPSTVIWNPWADKAASLKDLPDDGFLGFVCIETSIANDSAITLPPAENYTFSTKISVTH